ncbi:MAG: hypothetical protein IKW98_00390 [Prevotella sp.]|nr:hypothetical protein [Prevotella sp.]
MKQILFVFISALLMPMLAHAQIDVATYHADRQQLICYHANEDGNLEGIAVVDNDITIILMNPDATMQSIDNSLASLMFEYEDVDVNVNYIVDGTRLLRYIYRWKEDVDFQKLREKQLVYKGELTSLEKMDKYLNEGVAQRVYDIANHTLGCLKNPIRVCYGVLDQNPFESGKTKMIDKEVFDGIAKDFSTIGEPVYKKPVGNVFQLFNVWTEDWPSKVYQWLLNYRDWNRKLNEQEKSWRNGLRPKVLQNETTPKEVITIIKVIEKNRPRCELIYEGIVPKNIVTVTKDPRKEGVEGKLKEREPNSPNTGKAAPEAKGTNDGGDVRVPSPNMTAPKDSVENVASEPDSDNRSEEAKNAPPKGDPDKLLKFLNNFTDTTKYGVLDHVAIVYYTASGGEENWSYFREKGKLVLKSHTSFEGGGHRDYPYVRFWIDFANNIDPKVWGDVQIQLYTTPISFRILNTYIIDCRGTQEEYMNGHLPQKTSGNIYYMPGGY